MQKEAESQKLMEKKKAMNDQSEVQARDKWQKGMAALVLSMVQKMEKWDEGRVGRDIRGITYNLRVMVDLLREKMLGEGSRVRYLIADIVEIARDVMDPNLVWNILNHDIEHLEIWVETVKSYMLKLRVPEMRSEEVEEEEDDVDVVGMDEDVKLLLSKYIFNGEKQLSVAFITGMVGIGKTELARKLFNHKAVTDRFKKRAWARVSSEFSHREVLVQLVKQIVYSDKLATESESFLEKKDNRNLQKMLSQHLKGKPYFIVLDDVPKEMILRCILKCLPQEDDGSRLLFTTRSQSRSQEIQGILRKCSIHVVKALDSSKSWQLFLKTINCKNKFTSDDEFPTHLEKKGKEMLSGFGGVPSAIKKMGRQLAKKRKEGIEWEQLLESVDLDATLEFLEPSYHKLDPKLKSCFLYLACFKENTNIRREKFIQIWAAAGMATSKDRKRPYSNLQWLTKESMIEVKDYSMKSFCINSLLHRLAMKKAKDEIGFEILRSNGNSGPSQSPRHRVINYSRDKLSYSADQDKHLHQLVSLFLRGGGYLDDSPSYWESFEQLRVLDLEDFGLKVLPNAIGKLVELRYLGLRNNYLQELPDTLGGLINLEVLDIAQNFIVEMPDIILKLGSLRHLFVSDVIWHTPLKIDTLCYLVTLTYISVDDWTLVAVLATTSIKKLGIDGVDENSDISKLLASLAKIKCLDHLTLRGFQFRCMPSLHKLGMLRCLTKLKLVGILPRLPGAENFPPKLTSLKLFNSCLDKDPMPVLEELPELKYLKLRNAYTGQRMVVSKEGFPSLKVMGIEELWNLTSLKVGEDAMSDLTKLEIKNCPNLEILPKAIGVMTELEELKMVTTKTIATRIQKSRLISRRQKPKSDSEISSPFFLVMNDQF